MEIENTVLRRPSVGAVAADKSLPDLVEMKLKLGDSCHKFLKEVNEEERKK